MELIHSFSLISFFFLHQLVVLYFYYIFISSSLLLASLHLLAGLVSLFPFPAEGSGMESTWGEMGIGRWLFFSFSFSLFLFFIAIVFIVSVQLFISQLKPLISQLAMA